MTKININQTKFLNKEKDVQHKDVLTIVSEGVWEDSARFKRDDGSPQSQFNIVFKLKDETERSTALNWTNIKLLVTAFGDDSKLWIDKEVRAWKTKSEKAKVGYSYVFVPIDWNRDETGEWLNAEGEIVDVESKQESRVVDSEDDINPEDIPF